MVYMKRHYLLSGIGIHALAYRMAWLVLTVNSRNHFHNSSRANKKLLIYYLFNFVWVTQAFEKMFWSITCNNSLFCLPTDFWDSSTPVRQNISTWQARREWSLSIICWWLLKCAQTFLAGLSSEALTIVKWVRRESHFVRICITFCRAFPVH